MSTPDLIRHVTFLKPEIHCDADGDECQDYLAQFGCLAHIRLTEGREVFGDGGEAFRLGADFVMPRTPVSKAWVIIAIRDCAEAREVTSDWCVKVDGRTFRIQKAPRPEGTMLAMLAEASA